MRRAAAVGLTVLVLLALPDLAHSDTAKTVATGAAAGAIVGIACSSIALSAEDDETDGTDFARQGWHVGMAAAYAFETFEDDAEVDIQKELGPTVKLSVDDEFGFNGRVGYRCNRYLGGEVEVERIHGFDSDITQPGFVQPGKVRYDTLTVTANLKGFFLTGRYQPFLLVGAGAMTSHTKFRDTVGLTPGQSDPEDDNAFAMRFGGGIDLYATEHAVVNLEANYVLPFGDLDARDYVTITWGLQYRF